MKDSKRAVRRSHKRRMKSKARRVYPYDENAHKLADHLKFCDRYCCRYCDDNWLEWKKTALENKEAREQFTAWQTGTAE